MLKVQRDGISIFFEETGQGEPPLLFVHGGLVDHTHFQPQLDYFGGRHRCIAMDLRGHGQSDKPEEPYTIVGFAEDIQWMCAELGVSRPTIVGHSMGGLVALEIAARFGQLPSAIVILDAPVVPPDFFTGVVTPFVAAVKEPGYQKAIREFFGQFVGFADDPDQKEKILQQLASTPQHVAASVLANYLAYDTEAAASACQVPVLYISSGPWFTDVARFRELCPQLITGQTVGSGHYHQLEVPDQVNAMIRRFVEMTSADGK